MGKWLLNTGWIQLILIPNSTKLLSPASNYWDFFWSSKMIWIKKAFDYDNTLQVACLKLILKFLIMVIGQIKDNSTFVSWRSNKYLSQSRSSDWLPATFWCSRRLFLSLWVAACHQEEATGTIVGSTNQRLAWDWCPSWF